MKTGYFCKRIAIIFTVAFCFSACVYARYLKSAEKIGEVKTFYYLTTNSDSVEVCVLDVSKNGGAGFLTDCHSGDVALSVYFNFTDAEKVQKANEDCYANLKICENKTNALYVKGVFRKKSAKAVRADFENAYRQIETLDEALTDLENGGTQESVKRTLGAVKESCRILEKSAIKELQSFFRLGADSAADLEGGIVTTSKLRYFLCELCVSYAAATEKFSL